MASGSKWGSLQNRAYIYWEWSVTDPVPGSSTVTWAVNAYIQMDGASSISGNWNVNWWGWWGDGSQVSSVVLGPNQRQIIVTASNVATITDSPSSMGFGAGINQYFGRTEDVLYVPLPAKVYAPPAAPSTPVVTRTSDQDHTTQWNRNATAAAPYTQQQLQRASIDLSGSYSAWVGLSSINGLYTSGGAQSVKDLSTAPNMQYRNRIKVLNSVGEAVSTASEPYYTTPGKPSSVSAVKLSNSSIQVDFVPTVSHQHYISLLEYSLDGGATWSSLTSLAYGINSYTWNSVPSGSAVVFRVSAKIDNAGKVGHGLQSGFTESNSVPLLAPPNPPSNLSPNGVARVVDESFIGSWKHNSADSSTQQAYEIRYSLISSSWVSSGKIVSTNQFHDFVAGLPVGSYRWEVRTWGAHADPSPYSATAYFQVSSRPVVTITSPGSVVTGATVAATWSYFDAETPAQAGWEAQLLEDSAVIETRSGSGSASSVEFTSRLKNSSPYQIRVRALDGSGLWSDWDQHSFTTTFTEPQIPILSAMFNIGSGTVQFSVTNPTDSLTLVENEIFQSFDNGSTWIKVSSLPINGTGFDNEAPLGYDNILYKAVAWSDLPSSSESEEVSVSSVSDRGYWSCGTSLELILPMKLNLKKPPKIDLKTGLHVQTLHYFAGRDLPVETSGEARKVEGSVEFVVTSESQLMQARRMALVPAPHLFRLPDKTYLFASTSPLQDSRLAEGWYSIKMKIQEVSR